MLLGRADEVIEPMWNFSRRAWATLNACKATH